MSTFTNATKHRVTENFWKHGNRVLPRCSFAPERTFLARKGSPSSFYPSTTVLQHLISQSFFNSSVLTKYTQRAFYNSFLKLEEDRAVKKKKRKTIHYLIRKRLFCAPVLQHLWVWALGVWGAETPGCATRGRSPIGRGSRAAERAWEGNSPAAAKCYRPAQNTEKPHTALSTQGTGNIIVTGVW